MANVPPIIIPPPQVKSKVKNLVKQIAAYNADISAKNQIIPNCKDSTSIRLLTCPDILTS